MCFSKPKNWLGISPSGTYPGVKLKVASNHIANRYPQ